MAARCSEWNCFSSVGPACTYHVIMVQRTGLHMQQVPNGDTGAFEPQSLQ